MFKDCSIADNYKYIGIYIYIFIHYIRHTYIIVEKTGKHIIPITYNIT